MTVQGELPFGVADDSWWRDGAQRAIEEMARTGRVFQLYDVAVEHALPEPADSHMWGSLTSLLRKRGVIEPVGFEPSRRPTVAGSACRTWRGTAAYRQGAARFPDLFACSCCATALRMGESRHNTETAPPAGPSPTRKPVRHNEQEGSMAEPTASTSIADAQRDCADPVRCPSCGGVINLATGECRCS